MKVVLEKEVVKGWRIFKVLFLNFFEGTGNP
jgi:hypothetical protein